MTKKLALGGIVSAITLIILMTFIYLFQTVDLLLILILPIFSTVYFLKSDIRCSFLYLVATFLITLLIEPFYAFSLFLPSWIIGTIYGVCVKRKVPIYYSYLLSVLINCIAIALYYYSLYILTEINIISILNINQDYLLTVILLYSFAQSLIMLLIINEYVIKLGYPINKIVIIKSSVIIINYIIVIIMFLFHYIKFNYLPLFIIFIYCNIPIIHFINIKYEKKTIIKVVKVLLIFIAIIIIANYSLSVGALAISTIVIFDNIIYQLYLQKYNKSSKINIEDEF